MTPSSPSTRHWSQALLTAWLLARSGALLGQSILTQSTTSGTPTSTTTSLSALSTTAIKDGHRGHATATTHHPGHQQHASQGSLEAERADRISRLAGLSNVNQLRSPPSAGSAAPARNSNSPQTTPTSAVFPHTTHRPIAPLIQGAPAYFDSNGQPVAVTKMSTSGTASATESASIPGQVVGILMLCG